MCLRARARVRRLRAGRRARDGGDAPAHDLLQARSQIESRHEALLSVQVACATRAHTRSRCRRARMAGGARKRRPAGVHRHQSSDTMRVTLRAPRRAERCARGRRAAAGDAAPNNIAATHRQARVVGRLVVEQRARLLGQLCARARAARESRHACAHRRRARDAPHRLGGARARVQRARRLDVGARARHAPSAAGSS